MRKLILLLSCIFLSCIVCRLQAQLNQYSLSKQDLANTAPTHSFTYKVITNTDNSFGYEILAANKSCIRQLTIPGIPGSKGFTTKEDAEKVAVLVIEKMKNGIMPPSVTQQELLKLRIRF